MKTGIIRRIDDLGRVVIPKEIRRKLKIQEGDPLEISFDGNKVVFERYVPAYDYKTEVNRLIEMIKEDEYFLNEEKEKAIFKLKESRNVLCGAEKVGEDK